jgi:hypothetical protein
MTPEEMTAAAERLEQAEREHRQETGYGNATTRCIALSLRKGFLSSALAEWFNDGDKVHAYPKLRAVITQALGCRLHHQHDCSHWICKRIST